MSFTFSKESCIDKLTILVEKNVHALSLKDCALLQQSIKFLKKQEMSLSFSNLKMDEKTAISILFQAAEAVHKNKSFNLDEATFVFMCMETILKPEKEEEKEEEEKSSGS